ncbi:hypothetical protein [Afifella aestuarii]|uniref:hypothetical protein n=1 Tax=Afifella aestuarii TaxID=1909496 RepID=UPI000FE301F4|nr:hypothetical protein [Afifella aestuarii]
MATDRNNLAFANAGVAGAFQDSWGNGVDASVTNQDFDVLSNNDASDDDNLDLDDQDVVDIDDNDGGDDIDVAVLGSGNSSTTDIDTDESYFSGNESTYTSDTSVDVSNVGNETFSSDFSSDVSSTNTFNYSDDDVNTTGSNNTADVGVTDSFNETIGNVGNWSDTDIHTKMEQISDSDLVDVDGLCGNIDDLLSLGGDGNVFALDQVQTMMDSDFVANPTVTNNGHLDQAAYNIDGGYADATSGVGNVDGASDVGGNANAGADALADLSGFDQSISMGGNIQYASMNLDVVGGSADSDIMGDDT